ncbi:MAG TPA: winged helix-turn-helix transcriptional regulator [Firmicutes bacterium]|nr:winged helix-turn-helix transcriptional regulator [Bacillota bacterium]
MAEFLQGFANPARVRILCVLHGGEKSVGEIVAATGEKLSNVSQQLKILAAKGYVTRRRVERNIIYAIKDPAICDLMDQVRRILRLREEEPGGSDHGRGDRLE